VNRNFDFHNRQDPVETFVDDSLFWELNPNFKKSTNVYVRENIAEINNYRFGGPTDERVFFSVSNFREDMDDHDRGDKKLISLFIRMDKEMDIYERR